MGPLRIPVLLAGVGLVVAAPVLLRSRIGDRAALVFAWLLAISPSLVLYSRIVRSYLPATFLGFLAVVSLGAYLSRRRLRDGAGYAVSSVAATYTHLGAAPFVFSPFAFAWVWSVWAAIRGERRCCWRSLSRVGGAVAALLLVVIGPAAPSLVTVVSGKTQAGSAPLATVIAAAHLQAGTASSLLAGAVAILAVVGWTALLRRDRRFALLIASAVLGHLAALVILAPFKLEVPLVMNRYLLFATPFLLACVAVGLTTLFGRFGRGVPLASAVTLVVALFLSGPLTRNEYRTSAFVHGALDFLGAEPAPKAGKVPEVYRILGDTREPGTILEAPYEVQGPWVDVFRAYERIHRRPVTVALARPWSSKLDLRNTVAPDPEEILQTSARFVLVHVDLPRERAELFGGRPARASAERLRGVGAELARVLRRRWGPPWHESRHVHAWDLEAVRAGTGERRASPRK